MKNQKVIPLAIATSHRVTPGLRIDDIALGVIKPMKSGTKVPMMPTARLVRMSTNSGVQSIPGAVQN